MRRLLLEGGVAGHLSHLYDNRELTANQMFKILSLASQGELEGTEKTDGYNIYLGFRDGQARWARNKGEMRSGGRTMEELINRIFQGGEQVKDVYVRAFKGFEDFANKLGQRVQANIFGEDGSIFYNTEIQGPGANNVVNYDANVVSIHHGNHKRYDAETDTVEIIDAEENSRYLDHALNRIEQEAHEQNFTVKRTAVLKLRRLDDDTDLRIAIAKIEKTGFIGDMTINEYLESKILPKIQQKVPYMDSNVHQMMVDYILDKRNEAGQKTVSMRSIYKGFPVEQRDVVRNLLSTGGTLIKAAIWPIEDAIHDFAVELLRGLESVYILDNHAEVTRLKAEVDAAVRAIQAYSGPGADEARNVLQHQLRKVKHLDNINSAVEGFVFHHGGQMYKFTGNFAPVNQILGLFRYGRGNVPAISRDNLDADDGGELEEAEVVSHATPERVIAILPGAFKPPHKGHFQMALHYAEIADAVAVYISRIPREGVDFGTSKALWDIYIQASQNPAASKIAVLPEPSENASPVGAALEFVGNESQSPNLAQPGDYVILGASSKPDSKGNPDYMRFKDAQKYYAHGVLGGDLEDTKKYAFKVSEEPLSARDLRAAISRGDIEIIKRYIPDGVLRHEGGFESVLVETLEEMLIRMVEERLNEISEAVGDDSAGWPTVPPTRSKGTPCIKYSRQGTQMLYKGDEGYEECVSEKELEEISAMGGGAVQGAMISTGTGNGAWDGAATKKFNKKQKKDQKLKGTKLTKEALIEKVMDYLLTQAVN